MLDEDQFEGQLSAFDEFGLAFEQDEDPLKEFGDTFKNISKDPLEIYKSHRLVEQNVSENRRQNKIRAINKWKDHMRAFERHHACPTINQVGIFIDKEIEKKNSSSYIYKQLNSISNMFEYWSDHPKMPHGTGEAKGYNPIETARKFKKEDISKNKKRKKPQHPIGIEELSHRVRQIKNLLHRAVITTQLKFGLRGGQLSNIRIKELKIQHEGLNDLYPDLGTHHRLQKIDDQDIIYFAPWTERRGGKSARPIVMPIDTETKQILTKYLRQRPPVNKPWLFINNASGNQLRTEYLTNKMWMPTFHPKYSETEEFDAVTSHYARHRFNTYWLKEVGLNRELVKYMRGDKQDLLRQGSQDALDHYIHTYYTDISSEYLSNIYRLGI